MNELDNKDKVSFSIIVPVYNTEKYVVECLKSIIGQSYSNFEIIIIDDGSTDSSLNICKRFESFDKRIRLFQQENMGVSAARNRGLKEAKGDYVIFVDSDDYCSPRMLEIILPYLNKDYLITFGYKKIYKRKTIGFFSDTCELDDLISINEAIIMNNNIGGHICNKVFSLDKIRAKEIYFDTSIHHSEDMIFTLEYVKTCKKLVNISMILYSYRMRKSSASFSSVMKQNTQLLDVFMRIISNYGTSQRIMDYMEYQYLLKYWKSEKKGNGDDGIIKNEREILSRNHLSFKKKIEYYCVQKHYRFYTFLRKIKLLILCPYD